MKRFEGLLEEQAQHLDAFVKAKEGLEDVREKLAIAKLDAQTKIEAKREEQAKILAKLQGEIDEEKSAIDFVAQESKRVSKKIKSIKKDCRLAYVEAV